MAGGILLVAVLALLIGCGGPPAGGTTPSPTPSAVDPKGQAPANVAGNEGRVPCADGRLLIGDLPEVDRQWQAGLESATRKSLVWQPDARLISLRVGCQLFEPGFRWQATFYSARAQAFLASDTGETEPAEVPPERVSTLPTEGISFGMLRRSLLKSGFSDDDEISPSSGVELRLNTEAMPFGPPAAPLDVVLYYVAVDRLGETKDVFVSGADGTVYRFAAP